MLCVSTPEQLQHINQSITDTQKHDNPHIRNLHRSSLPLSSPSFMCTTPQRRPLLLPPLLHRTLLLEPQKEHSHPPHLGRIRRPACSSSNFINSSRHWSTKHISRPKHPLRSTTNDISRSSKIAECPTPTWFQGWSINPNSSRHWQQSIHRWYSRHRRRIRRNRVHLQHILVLLRSGILKHTKFRRRHVQRAP